VALQAARKEKLMAVFFEPARGRTVKDALADALTTHPDTVDNVEQEAEDRAAAVAPAGYAKFNAGRFLGAVVLWALVVVAAIVTEATDLDTSSDALWGAAAIVFGVVVGFLAGEKSAAPAA
jgi:hypothetical protein